MIKGKTITLCLPCRNEGAHLKSVISQVPESVDEIIIISNASNDNTVEVARNIGGKVKVLEDNRTVSGIGYGFAHMTAIKEASGDIIIGADGDGTYPLEKIDFIATYLLEKQLDFLSCNRYPVREGTKIPFKLQLGVKLLNYEIRLLYGIKINDSLSGMWAFRKEVKNKLNLTEGDWNLSPQIKINAARNKKISFGEYHIAQRDRYGDTKQSYFKTGLSHALWILKNRISSD